MPSVTTLAQLLAPVGIDRFLAEHWGRRALFVRGTPDKVRGLLDLDGFLQAIRSPALPDIEATLTDSSRERTTERIRITGAEAAHYYGLGATVCAYKLDAVVPALAELCRSARREIGFTGEVDVRAYWSRHGEGFLPHFDARSATVVQIRGKKVWRFAAEPSVAAPPANAALGGVGGPGQEPTFTDGTLRPQREDDTAAPPPALRLPPPEAFEEVELAPGDVLCLPPGTWHTACATGHSLAINLAFAYRQGGDVFSLVAEALRSRLAVDPSWRACPPPATAGDTLDDFFAARLDELRAALEDGPGLARAVRHALRKARLPAVRPDPGFARERSWIDCAPTQHLQRNDIISFSISVDSEACWLYYSGPDGKGGLAFAADQEALLRELLAEPGPFEAAGAVAAHGDWDRGRRAIERLLRIGLLIAA